MLHLSLAAFFLFFGGPNHLCEDEEDEQECEEEVEVELTVAEMRTKAISYHFRFWKNPDAERALAASGEFVVVAVTAAPGTREMRATAIPENFRARIEAAPVNTDY